MNERLQRPTPGLLLGVMAAAWVTGTWGLPDASAGTGEKPDDRAIMWQTVYENYAAVLDGHVDESGMVDYRALKADRRRLDAFVSVLGRVSRRKYAGWSRNEKVAFWINAYNAITLRIVIDNYPIKSGFFASLVYPKNSIRQIDDVFTGIEFPVMGRRMSLDDIEHGTLRKQFNEPRIHLALVCAALSCPTLRDEPYMPGRLEEQFKEQGRDFVSHADNFRIDRRGETVYLSSIFDWFGEDFVGTYGTETRFRGHDEAERAVLNYLSRHLNPADRSHLLRADYDIEYLDYDWTLNEQKRRR